MRKRYTKRHMKQAMTLGRIIGTLVYLLDAPHRRIVRTNLRLAFPGLHGANRRISNI